jgi:hypothetical protein
LFGFDNFNSKGAVDCGKEPLVLKSTFSIDGREISDSHDKVVDEFFRERKKTSIFGSFPSLVNNDVFFGTLNIISIINDLREMEFLYSDPC